MVLSAAEFERLLSAGQPARKFITLQYGLVLPPRKYIDNPRLLQPAAFKEEASYPPEYFSPVSFRLDSYIRLGTVLAEN